MVLIPGTRLERSAWRAGSLACSLANPLASALVCALALAACEKKGDSVPPPPPPPPPAAAAAALKDVDPRWVDQQPAHARTAVVFVHGLTGDTLSTWTNPNRQTFFSLLKAAPQVGAQVDVFAFGFTSQMFAGGSLDIREAANKMHQSLKVNGVLDYPSIVFVAHSMGGLVTLRYLVNHRELIDKTPLVALFAVPQEGSQVAAVGQYILNNPATRQMIPADANAFLQTLNDDWRSLPKRPHVVCGYEKLPWHQLAVVVPWSSSTRFCDGASVAIEGTDHESIVKPDRLAHDSVVLLVNALNDYVVGKNLVANLETPDFIPEADHLVFTLTDPNGRSSARLVNSGRARLRYTLAAISDPNLYLWPDDTPRDLDGEKSEQLKMALGFGALASEYRFVIQSDAGEPRTVVVRIKDLKALQEKQAQLRGTAVQALNLHLSDPARLKALSDPGMSVADARGEAAGVVQAAIAKASPDLPEGAQWVMAADVLAASNWPGLAHTALQRAEVVSPSVARSPGGQLLAAQIAAGSGEKKVFAQGSAFQVDGAAARVLPPADAGRSPETSASLALKLQQIPALREFGFSLQGDLALSQGDKEAARRAYTRASELKDTPSIATRIKALDREGAAVRIDRHLAEVPTSPSSSGSRRRP